MTGILTAWREACCPDCEQPIQVGDPVVPVIGGMPDEILGYAHAYCPAPAETIAESVTR